MPTGTTLGLFIVTVFALVALPGPNILYIITRSVDRGRRAGIVSVLGVATATVIHIIAISLGISSILFSSALAFSVVKYAGAAYLFILGIRRLLTHDTPKTQVEEATRQELWLIYRDGFITNLLNPKVALFYLALFPQFIDPTRGSVVGQTLVLGGILFTVAVLNDSTYALLASAAGLWLKRNRWYLRAERYISGGIYILLGAITALLGIEKR